MTELISGISVLLVFAVIFLEMMENKITALILKPKPSSDEIMLQKGLKSEFLKTIWRRSVPLVISLFGLTYILLPTTFDIILSSKPSLWFFDPVLTVFVAVNVGIFILTVISINQLYRITKRYKAVFSHESSCK